MSQLSPLKRRGPRMRIRIDPRDPRALAICDGCGLPTMHHDLRKHMDYRGGTVPVWDGLMVCANCDDQPQPYFKKQVLRPDPVPVENPRPDDGSPQNVLATQDADPIWTDDEQEIVVD